MASISNKIMNVDEAVMQGVLSIIGNGNTGKWTGTMTELRTTLNRVLGRKQAKVLPGSPGALRIVLNRVVNRLRNRRISVRFARTTDHARTRFVRFTR
jgi:hypothetical protein